VTKLTVAAFALVALGAVTSAATVAAPPILFAAHRGGALLWPENSLLAFENAIQLGADFIEFDVHLSRDGEPMVIHDPTLERTTTGTGRVREQTSAEIRAARLRDRDGTVTAEAVPTLDEVVALAARSRRQMLLEIKVDDRQRAYPGIEEKVMAVLDRHAMTPATVVMAFEPETWRRVRALRSDVRVAALDSSRTLESRGVTLAGAIEEARAAGLAVVGLHQRLVTAETVARARKAGLVLAAWTVNEEKPMRELIELGVGVVISDRPDLAKRLLGR
jgi:glycerophosphoryl diester phosphodiesterase